MDVDIVDICPKLDEHLSNVHLVVLHCSVQQAGLQLSRLGSGGRGMEGWRDVGVEGWRGGGVEGWRDGWMDGTMKKYEGYFKKLGFRTDN